MRFNRKTKLTVGDVINQTAFAYGADGAVAATWIYTKANPLAVVLRIFTGRGKFVDWVFSRNLLINVLEMGGEYGVGDIKLISDCDGYDDLFTIELNTPNGQCVLDGSVEDAKLFVIETLRLVPPCDHVWTTCENKFCQEHMSINQWIDGLLS